MNFRNCHVGVVGAGASGLAAARFLLPRNCPVLLVDDDPAKLAAAQAAISGQIEFRPARAVLVGDASAWVISPGVPPTHPLVDQILRSDKGYGDLDLWQVERRVMTIAVTGTNGKSTVTRLIAATLAAAGWRVAAGGNLGTPACAFVNENLDRAVLEVSSFQLFYARLFRPEIAVLTNIAPDHLDWHPTLEHYVDAKKGMFRGLGPEATAVLPHDERERVPVGDGTATATFGHDAAANACIGDEAIALTWGRRGTRVPVPPGFLPPHQRENLAAAALTSFLAGVAGETIAASAAAYEPLPYRFATVAEHRGVRFINDSKATNLHAMTAAVASAGQRVHLLVGGKRKGLDWAAALPALRERVVAAYTYGESRDDVAAAWRATLPVTVAETLGEATKAAYAAAQAGDVVLLAPGTSSFDQFGSYSERGKTFDLIVTALVREAAP